MELKVAGLPDRLEPEPARRGIREVHSRAGQGTGPGLRSAGYSARRAIIGSTRVARRAGKNDAAKETTATSTNTAA